ncbi:MAG TPA: hypothetical protein DCZ94_14325 [Lentisphaeria bacterium]|nr:MAG: hypothetical protein A2X48_01710 [Lentisphaerae bacterium GWF2_49_21]HBC88123.1 hypothetical protein [Lentisphaeria bacterium]
MTFYKIQILTTRDVHNPGTKRQLSGNEYVHSIIIYLSDEDSSWLSFNEAKAGAISFIKKFFNNHEMTLDETNRTTRKMERLENLTEKDIPAMLKPGQKIITL